MRLRTFHADDILGAMQLVRDEMGDEAIIIATQRGTSGKGVTVTAAIDEEEIDFTTPPATHDYQEKPAANNNQPRAPYVAIPDYFIRDLQQVLAYHGITGILLEEILRELRHMPKPEDDSSASMERLLTELLPRVCRFSNLRFSDPGTKLIFIGPPGAGKTLTTAKLASRAVTGGHKVVVISTDYKRAGGTEQLSAFTDILDIELNIASSRSELKSILADCDPEARIFIDSSGANPYEFSELKELSEFAGLMELKPVLVYPSGSDPQEASEISQAFSFLGVEHMIVTRTDAARRFGSVLTAAHGAGIAISHLTGSEKVLGPFQEATPKVMSHLLMRQRKETTGNV